MGSAVCEKSVRSDEHICSSHNGPPIVPGLCPLEVECVFQGEPMNVSIRMGLFSSPLQLAFYNNVSHFLCLFQLIKYSREGRGDSTNGWNSWAKFKAPQVQA